MPLTADIILSSAVTVGKTKTHLVSVFSLGSYNVFFCATLYVDVIILVII